MSNAFSPSNGSGQETEIDPEQLRHHLEIVSSKYQKNYMDRRKNHLNPDPIEELQNAIEEVNERQREIHGIIGIAHNLMDKNEVITSKFHKYNEQIDWFESQIQRKDQEVQLL